MNYAVAANLIAAKKRQAQSQSEERYNAAMRQYPLLEKAERDFRRAVITGDKKLTSLRERERNDMIISLGFAAQDFFPAVSCKYCNDSGYVNGAYCSCVKKFAAKDTSGEAPPPFTFETADMSVFTDEFAPKAYFVMKAFCAKFPSSNNTNILIIGRPGTGKTYLAACVANELLLKDFGVVFVSAFKFNDLCLKYHTSFDSAKSDYLSALIDSDLLVIDDLGSESILRNVTLEYLFTVVDERMRAGKHTVITTNLSQEKLEARYSERTASRLFSERVCIPIVLDKEDLRKRK